MNTSHSGLLAQPGGESREQWLIRNTTYDSDAEFLHALHALQDGLMFDDVMMGENFVYGISGWTAEPMWNNAIVIDQKRFRISKLDTNHFKYNNRQPGLYFPINAESQRLVSNLTSKGWTEGPVDEWMKFRGKPPDPSDFAGVVDRVQTASDLKTFIRVLRRAHQDTNSYTNPYGQLSDGQSRAVARTWEKGHQSGAVSYYVVYDGDEHAKNRTPVAVASLTHWSDRFGRKMGLISNVGTDADQVRHGYGRTATLSCVSEFAVGACVAESISKGSTVITLATEPGQGPREAFSKMGFARRMLAGVWVNNKVPLDEVGA